MTPNGDAGPGSGLSKRLRDVRRQRQLSARELARRAGCSASLISQIERGATAPSARMLYVLAIELQTSLDYLFGVDVTQADNEAAQDTVTPTAAVSYAEGLRALRNSEGTVGRLHRERGATVHEPSDTRGTSHNHIIQKAGTRRCIELAGGVRWERLTPTSDPYVDFLEVIYEPRGNSDPSQPALRHDGREYGLVLNGKLRAQVGFDTYELDAGDSIVFDSSTPHAYLNPSDEFVHAIWIIVHREPWRA